MTIAAEVGSRVGSRGVRVVIQAKNVNYAEIESRRKEVRVWMGTKGEEETVQAGKSW